MYKPFDQHEHFDGPPWEESEALKEWEEAHGHDVRLKCYPEFGCQAIEYERQRLEEENGRLKDEFREEQRWSTGWQGLARRKEDEAKELKEQRDIAVQLLKQEHDLHHPDCCVDEDDLCHVGQLLATRWETDVHRR